MHTSESCSSVVNLDIIGTPSSSVCSATQTAVSSDFQGHFGRISQQSTFFFAGTIFTSGASYFFKVYLARMMGAEALGIYALGMTVVGFAGVIGGVGLPQAAARFVAVYWSTGQTKKLGQFLSSSIVVLLLTNLLVGSILLLCKHWFAVRLYHTPALTTLMPFFVAIMFLGALTTFYGQCLAGYKDVAKRTAITNFIGSPLTMIGSITMLTVGLGLRGYLVAQVFSAALVLVALGWTTWRLTPAAARIASNQALKLEREVVSFSSALFAIQGLEFLSTQTDRVLLGLYLSAREVGIYATALALVSFVPIVLQSVNQIFAPTIAELYAKQEDGLLLRLYQTLTKWTLGCTVPLALVMMIFARPLMGIFGHEFAGGWPVLVIATAGQLVNCGVGSVGQLLVMSGHQQRMVRAQCIVVPVTIALSFGLIPSQGLVGAAVAAATANALLNLLMLRDINKFLGFCPSGQGYFSLAVPVVSTVVVLYLVRFATLKVHPEFMSILVALLVGYAVFGLSVMKTGLDDEDKMLARNTWERFFGQRMHAWRHEQP